MGYETLNIHVFNFTFFPTHRNSSVAEMTPVRRSIGEALWGMCAADSMSMPVHWYYSVYDIRKDFEGWITGFNAPKNRHPSSILTLSNSGAV